jgi:serine protease AprX
MKALILGCCCIITASLAMPAHSDGPLPAASETLKVMLQGSSATSLAELVTRNGGVVTHYLPIINAVGARLNRAALDKILASPLVDRHLDDLSISSQPDEKPVDEDKTCDVGGSLELELEGSRVNWMLYNKHEQPAKLSALEISWPASLGELSTLKLGNKPLTLPSTANPTKPHSLRLEFDNGKHPEVATATELEARFTGPERSPDSRPIMQREFKIDAQFVGECSTKLIPGYTDNHANSYFPSVVGADALHRNGITGKNVTVAIIDSGLWQHDALIQDTNGNTRLLASYDAIANTEKTEVFDESGHGTHMASVLAHSGPVSNNGEPTGSFKGIAPDVNLVAVKAFNVEGQGDFLDIVRAIQYVVDNREKYSIKVLNLSFAARPRWEYWLDPINQAVMRAWASGITVVAAAGNEGPDPMTIGSPGNLPYVITVGAVTDSWTLDTRSDDYIPDFSSRGPTPNAHIKPDLVAPGGHMTGLTRPGSTLAKSHPEYFLSTGEFVMTGSSQASALVSGIAALLLQLEPDLSPDDIKCKMMSSAEPAINNDGLLAYSPFVQGNGYVSATRAITLGQRGCGNMGLDVNKDINGDHYQGPAIIDENGNTSLPGLDKMQSQTTPEKGMSDIRKWGVKAHIERPRYEWADGNAPGPSILNWERIYLEEKARIEQLKE